MELHFPVLLSVVDPFVNTNIESGGSHKVTVTCKGDSAVAFWLLRNPKKWQKILVHKK